MTAFYHFIPCQAAQPRGTLAVLPGVNSGAYLFTESAAKFAAHWHVLLINPPGVDGVPLNAAGLPFSVAGYARYAAEAIRQAHTHHHLSGPLAVLGHSLGSYTAQALARQLLQQPLPGLPLAKLILVSSSAGQPYTAQDIANLQFKLGKSFWQYSRELERDPATGMLPLFGSWPQNHPAAYATFLQQRKAHLPGQSASLAQLTAGGMFTSMGWARQLNVPTLCLHGTADLLVSPTGGRALQAQLPLAEWHEYPDVGHFPMLETPAFAADILRFLGTAQVTSAPTAQPGTFIPGPQSLLQKLKKLGRWLGVS